MKMLSVTESKQASSNCSSQLKYWQWNFSLNIGYGIPPAVSRLDYAYSLLYWTVLKMTAFTAPDGASP